MRRLWRAFEDLWDLQEAPTVMAWVRIGISLALLWDLAALARLDLVTVLWTPVEGGGLPAVLQRSVVPELYRWLPPTATTAWLLWGGMVAAAASLALGWRTRTAAVVLMLLSAQANLVAPLADRGIDKMLRNVLMLLAFSSAGRAWSVQAWRETGRWRGDPALRTPAWPRHLLVLQLVVVYFTAGLHKTALSWSPAGDFAALYIVLRDPTMALRDFTWLASVYPLTQLGTVVTMLFELTAPLVLAVYWARYTADRPGRLRRWALRWRPHLAWAAVGVALHVGIALSMALGMFPWAMLACYPAFLHPDERPWPLGVRPPALPGTAAG